MIWLPAFERSAKYNSGRCGLTKLMSKDRSGLPGIWTAVRHLVCVSVGAPRPVQAPNAAPDAASDTAPSSAEADESLADMFVSPLVDECDARKNRASI